MIISQLIMLEIISRIARIARISRISAPKSTPHLGRWTLHNDSLLVYLKVDQANTDHSFGPTKVVDQDYETYILPYCLVE